MGRLTDEMLMAYADGELDPAERARIETALKDDAEARERLRIFVATGAPLAQAFSKPMHEPVPPHLIAVIMNHKPSQTPRKAGARRTSLSSLFEAAGAALSGGARWSTALAWSAPVLIAVVGAIGYFHHRAREPELVALQQGQIIAQGPLKHALDTAPSGTLVPVGQKTGPDFTMRVVLTFKNRHHAFCRQYDLMTPEGSYAGIACRGRKGQWHLEIHMAAAPRTATPDRAVPAGKGTNAIEAAVGKVIEGDALGPEDEKALIQKKWAQ